MSDNWDIGIDGAFRYMAATSGAFAAEAFGQHDDAATIREWGQMSDTTQINGDAIVRDLDALIAERDTLQKKLTAMTESAFRWKRYAQALAWLDGCGTSPERHEAGDEVEAALTDLEGHGDV